MAINGYQQYKTQSINTMTQSELLLLLYDELVKRLTRAEIALEDEDYPIFEQSVTRSREIIDYLKQTLRREFEVSRGLVALYDFFIFELGRANASRKKDPVTDVKRLVMELRDAFRQASKKMGN